MSKDKKGARKKKEEKREQVEQKNDCKKRDWKKFQIKKICKCEKKEWKNEYKRGGGGGRGMK